MVALVIVVSWLVAGRQAERLPLLVRDVKVNVAVGLLLLAVSWMVPRFAAAAAGVVAMIATLTIVQYCVSADLGLDQLLATDSSDRHGRMRLATAICLLALTVARLLLQWPTARRARAAELLSLAVHLVSTVGTIGYVFERALADTAAGLSFLPLLSSTGLQVLSLVFLARIPGGFGPWLVTGHDSGALLLRRVLPFSVVAVPAVILADVLLVRHGLLPGGLAAPIAAVAIMLVVTVALTHTSLALRESDRARDRAADALTAVNYDLEERVRERADQLSAEHVARDILLERDRIAADMHDHVIQRLYALGMDLERRSAAAGFQADATIDGLDAAIADLRRTIHDLRTAPAAHGLETELRDLVEAVTARFDDGAHLTITGELDAISDEVRLHLLAVAREAISNAVRHSGARRLDLALVVDAAGTALTVSDDGRGIPHGVESTSGLRNMRERAARCGGMATWQPRHPTGTLINWFVAAEDEAAVTPATPAVSVSDAVAAFADSLAASAGESRLATAAGHLRRMLCADAAIALTPARDGMLAIWSTGFGAGGAPDGNVFPFAGSLSGHVATTRKPVRVASVTRAPVAQHTEAVTATFGPAITLPVATAETTHGVIVLLRLDHAAAFTSAEEQAALLFCTCVAALVGKPGEARALEPAAATAGPASR